MSDSLEKSLSQYLEKVRIPLDIARRKKTSGSSTSIERWKDAVAPALNGILDIISAEGGIERDEQAVVFCLLPFIPGYVWQDLQHDGPFISLDNWITPESLRVAQDLAILPFISRPSRELVRDILTQTLRPIFKSSPHPLLHSESGRKLPGPAGGFMAMQDYYEGQRWKEYPGIANVVLWCVHAIEPDAFEHMWHLVIPPVMTLLDDYETEYKLQGVIIVEEMLRRVPKDLLKRTGVDGLLRQCLRNALSHLEGLEAADLISTAIRASVDLILCTTSVDSGANLSSERFDQLCSLLGEGIVAGIWLYADDKPLIVNATFEVLPHLVGALGMGTVRFLQALIPQLTHTLIPRPLMDSDRKLQVSALKVLVSILSVSSPRINAWKETILNAIGRCWVGVIDEETKEMNEGSRDVETVKKRNTVKKELQAFCAELAQICPSVLEDEYLRILNADRALFQNLFIKVPV